MGCFGISLPGPTVCRIIVDCSAFFSLGKGEGGGGVVLDHYSTYFCDDQVVILRFNDSGCSSSGLALGFRASGVELSGVDSLRSRIQGLVCLGCEGPAGP